MDCSEVSRLAADYAAAITEANNAQLCVVHTVPSEFGLTKSYGAIPQDEFPAFTVATHNPEELVSDTAISRLRRENIVEYSDVSAVVPDPFRRQPVDLLVLGTHGRKGIEKPFRDSVSEKLFRTVTCPVLTVGPEAAPARKIQRILFVTDFGVASIGALPYAIDLAENASGELILLHLVPPLPVQYIGPLWYPGTDIVEREEADKKASLEQLRSLFPPDAAVKCRTEHVVEVHMVPSGIINFATDRNVDLIVMGVRESGISSPGVTAYVSWAIAYDVVCSAPCPVLTVRG